MKLGVIESPFAGCVSLHEAYLDAAMRILLRRGIAAFGSHGLYPGALDDKVPAERALGIGAGIAIRDALHAQGATSYFFLDLGWSSGMRAAAESLRAQEGLYQEETIPLDSPEWARISDQAQYGDSAFADCLRGCTGADPREHLLAARELYLQKYG